MSKRTYIILLIIVAAVSGVYAQKAPKYLKEYKKLYQQDPRSANLEWFKDAKFGLFIHYGLYSQLGRGEWAQLLDTIPLKEYSKLADSFTAENFDADFIVNLAKKAGMKYITITAKHHEGFCLFNTTQTTFNSLNTPAKRDLIEELARACEKGRIGLFIYYSYAADWKHPYFYDREDGWPYARPKYAEKPEEYKYEKPEDFRIYVDFVHEQLREILTQYPTVAGIWFDPVASVYANPDVFPIEETYSLIRDLSPHALISFKQGANGDEDFVAPERASNAKMGEQHSISSLVAQKNKDKPVEVCNTMQRRIKGIHGGTTWGYNSQLDEHHLTVEEVQKLLSDAEKSGYNLLLNIGPLPDGAVHPEDVKVFNNLKAEK